jgi:dipeptidyl aminopeptidase/acylaminoacyl peptidase
MTWLRAVVVLLALSACGCGSAGKTGDNGSVPARHYLVYTKLIDEPGIWIADADGGDPRLLVRDGFNPAISPDGRRVAYSAYCERESYDCSNVFIVDTGSRSEPRLLGKRLGGTIRWTSDSKRLVVETSSTENVHELAAIDVESGKVTRLADGKFWGWSLSPDGERIVFALGGDKNPDSVLGIESDLFVEGLDGGKADRITDTGEASDPVWGPKSIAFSKLISCLGPDGLRPRDEAARIGCFNDSWGRDEIWRIQPDGTGQARITKPLPKVFQNQGCIGLVPIDWSGDGRALLAAWRCEFSDAPVEVDPETGAFDQQRWAASTAGLSRDGGFELLRADDGPETPPDKETVLIAPFAGGKPSFVLHGARDPSWNR